MFSLLDRCYGGEEEEKDVPVPKEEEDLLVNHVQGKDAQALVGQMPVKNAIFWLKKLLPGGL